MTNKIILIVLSIGLVFTACKKKNTSTPATTSSSTSTSSTTGGSNPSVIDINSNDLISYTMGGTNYFFEETTTNDIQSGVGSSKDINTSGGTSKASFDSYLYNTTTSKTYGSIEKGTLFYNFTTMLLDSTSYSNFFKPLAYAYSPAGAIILNGCVITIYDANNVAWSTNKGTGLQSGSAISIIQNRFYYYGGDEFMKVYMTFNCIVYDGNGNSKVITNGKYVGSFGNI
jgi:hypothetical protein